MDSWHQVCERLAKALGRLKPDRIDLLETDKRILTIMVVSARYVGLRSITRFRLTDALIRMADADLYRDFLFIYEAWTPAEFASFSIKQRGLRAPTSVAQVPDAPVDTASDVVPVDSDTRYSPAE